MKYNDLLLKHFNEPNYIGQLSAGENVYYAEAGISGGDKVNLSMHITVDGKIDDVRYQVKGCPAMIASMSWIASEVIGGNILSVKETMAENIIEVLELPAHKQRCALLAEEVLQKIISKIIDDRTE